MVFASKCLFHLAKNNNISQSYLNVALHLNTKPLKFLHSQGMLAKIDQTNRTDFWVGKGHRQDKTPDKDDNDISTSSAY